MRELIAPTPTPTKILVIQPLVNLFFPSSTPRPSATPLPTSTLRPTATATFVPTRVAVLPPAPQPALPQGFRSVTGVVFADTNRNGVQDADEPGLPNVQLEAMTADGMSLITYSGSDGRYVVSVPLSDFYLVVVQLPRGLIPTLTDKQQFRENGFDVTSNFPLAQTSIALLWALLILLGASFAWLIAQAVAPDRRADAIRSLGEEIETAFSVRLQSNTIEKTSK